MSIRRHPHTLQPVGFNKVVLTMLNCFGNSAIKPRIQSLVYSRGGSDSKLTGMLNLTLLHACVFILVSVEMKCIYLVSV